MILNPLKPPGKAILVGVDADGSKGAGVNQEYNVTSFPTILYFEKGTYQFKFTGERTKDGKFITLYNACLEMFVCLCLCVCMFVCLYVRVSVLPDQVYWGED